MLPLASQGRLPFLASVIEGGAYGRLASITPNRHKALWTTLATGKYPYKHGLVGERRYPTPWITPSGALDLLPAGMAFPWWGTFGADPIPTDARDRRVLAMWEILPRLGVGTGLVGWPASDPASEAVTPNSSPTAANASARSSRPDAGSPRPSTPTITS